MRQLGDALVFVQDEREAVEDAGNAAPVELLLFSPPSKSISLEFILEKIKWIAFSYARVGPLGKLGEGAIDALEQVVERRAQLVLRPVDDGKQFLEVASIIKQK